MGSILTRENNNDTLQYEKQRRANQILQTNLDSRTVQVQQLRTENDKLRRQIDTRTESVAMLHTLIDKEKTKNIMLESDINTYQVTTRALTKEKHLLLDELKNKQQAIDAYKQRVERLLQVIHTVDSTIEGLSDETVSESS